MDPLNRWLEEGMRTLEPVLEASRPRVLSPEEARRRARARMNRAERRAADRAEAAKS